MGGAQRNKGKRGERELAALLTELTGHPIRRRVRQVGGDDDLVGLPGWSIEVKRHHRATRADLVRWWRQAAAQADRVHARALLCWRADRMREWCFVWGAGWHCERIQVPSAELVDTLAADPPTWWAMAQELPVSPAAVVGSGLGLAP